MSENNLDKEVTFTFPEGYNEVMENMVYIPEQARFMSLAMLVMGMSTM